MIINTSDLPKKAGYIKIYQDLAKQDILYLTPKGYNKAIQLLKIPYKFRPWSKSSIRRGSLYHDHHYLLYRFFLDYYQANGLGHTIWTDYDTDAVLKYTGGEGLEVKPDGIIKPKNNFEEMICVEADTGTMTSKQLYEKLLRYFLFAHCNFGEYDIRKLKIYFSFDSSDRLQNVFSHDPKRGEGLFARFNRLRLAFLSISTQKAIELKFVKKYLEEGRIEIYGGVYNQRWNNYKKIEFWDELLKANPQW
jgi:hypothetical protein